MSLTTYDPVKGCFVLKPEQPPIINAFHPDYVKTYMPEFMSSIRIEATQKANGQVNGSKAKAAREAVNKAAFTVVTNTKHPIRAAHLHRPNLAPTDFHIYQKAGMPKGVKK
jgi:hypothetical protein